MNNSDDIFKHIESLESRISNIEKSLNIESHEKPAKPISVKSETIPKLTNTLEQQVGVFWLAKIGILVFAVGLIFIISLSFSGMPKFIPSLVGFLFAGLIFAARKYGKKWLQHIDNYLLTTGFILLFYSVLRLSHFSKDVFIQNNFVEILVSLALVIALFTYSLNKKSLFLTSLSTLFAFITILLINNSSIALAFGLIISIAVVLSARKHNWSSLIMFGIILAYSSFFIWFAGNPFLSDIADHSLVPTTSLLYVLGVFVIYALGIIVKEKGKKEEMLKITSIFINSLLAASAFLVSTYANNKEELSLFTFIAFVVFLLVAFASWIYERSKYATFFYSIIGFTLLSVSIIAGFEKTETFIILSWQSLLVVSTAIWFRSKIIIIANFLIFLCILIAFLFFASEVTYISISFGIIALISARLLNWKKKELDLNSEGMRNAYLVCAFFIFPYTLYNSMPEGFITISWIGVAVLYYILSVLLKNVKYRWLALATLILSVVYVIFFGASGLSPELRILTFIVLGIVLLITSILYSKKKVSSSELTPGEIEESSNE